MSDLGDQAVAQKRPDDARGFYRVALQLDPANQAARVAIDRLGPEPPALERQAQVSNVRRQAFTTEVRQRIRDAQDLLNKRNPEAALRDFPHPPRTLRAAVTSFGERGQAPPRGRTSIRRGG